MKKYILFIFFVATLTGCSYILPKEPIQDVSANSKFVLNDKLSDKANPLEEQLKLSYTKIDSLYEHIDNLNYTIDSLYQALEIANNRIAINKDFVIPDSIVFAGEVFNLRNERIFSKFKKIYNTELRGAYKFIPRTTKYFPIIDSILQKNGVPEDAKYLAVAESRLTPMATSRVGAAGIWQFMKKTAIGYGMKINSFVDERRDIYKSTEAAAKYLKNSRAYLRKTKKSADWLLAFCAYNAGAGSISRLMKKQGSGHFFDLIFRADETHKYIWRALAIKLIIENEKKIFGKRFDRQKNLLDEVKVEKLKLKGYYKLDGWTKAQNTSLGKIVELNPWIKIYKRRRRKYSSINDIVLPPGTFNVLLPKSAKRNEKLAASIERKFLSKNSGYFTFHRVKKGDSLYKIARKYHTTVRKIKLLNNLKSDIIRPGQKLRLYGSTKQKTKKVYIVKKGDSINRIARRLRISSKKLIVKNSLKKNRRGNIIIHPGQKLFY